MLLGTFCSHVKSYISSCQKCCIYKVRRQAWRVTACIRHGTFTTPYNKYGSHRHVLKDQKWESSHLKSFGIDFNQFWQCSREMESRISCNLIFKQKCLFVSHFEAFFLLATKYFLWGLDLDYLTANLKFPFAYIAANFWFFWLCARMLCPSEK